MKQKRFIIMSILLAASVTFSAQSIYPGQHTGKMKKETVAPMQVQSFDYNPQNEAFRLSITNRIIS